MSFIQRELDKLFSEDTADNLELSAMMYGARQALSWASDPNAFASPLAAAARRFPGLVTGIPEATEDCQAERRPL